MPARAPTASIAKISSRLKISMTPSVIGQGQPGRPLVVAQPVHDQTLPVRHRQRRAVQRPSAWPRVSGIPKVADRCSSVRVSSIGPAATTAPSRSSSAWVKPGGISSTWWETRTIAGRGGVGGQRRQRGDEVLAPAEVEPGGGLVEEQQLGVDHQRPRDLDPLALALAQGAEGALGELRVRRARPAGSRRGRGRGRRTPPRQRPTTPYDAETTTSCTRSERGIRSATRGAGERRCAGGARRRRRAPSTSSSTAATPVVGWIWAEASCSSVVLPAPLGPSTTQRSSASTVQFDGVEQGGLASTDGDIGEVEDGSHAGHPNGAGSPVGVQSRAVSTHLPPSGRLAWWATAWLHGHVVTDLVVDAVLGDDVDPGRGGAARPRAGRPGAAPTPWSAAWRGCVRRVRGASARRSRSRATRSASAGPRRSTRPPSRPARRWSPTSASAWSRSPSAPATTWVAVRRPAPPAARRRRGRSGPAPRAAGGGLARWPTLDVARWRPEVADLLMNLRHRDPLAAPPGVPQRCVDLAERATQALAIVEAALVDDGAAISAHEARRPPGGAGRARPRRAARPGRRVLAGGVATGLSRSPCRGRGTVASSRDDTDPWRPARDPPDHAHRQGPARRDLRGLQRPSRRPDVRGPRRRADRAAAPPGARRAGHRAARLAPPQRRRAPHRRGARHERGDRARHR